MHDTNEQDIISNLKAMHGANEEAIISSMRNPSALIVEGKIHR